MKSMRSRRTSAATEPYKLIASQMEQSVAARKSGSHAAVVREPICPYCARRMHTDWSQGIAIMEITIVAIAVTQF
jgi:hypothetical protein